MFRTADMLEIFQQYRGDAIVVPGRGGRHWVSLSTKPSRDVPLGDPAMGGHASFACGLALAQPDKKVIVFDSEGDLLMNLGILPTIAEQAPKNFYHFLLDNECYATTGGQPVPNAKNVAYDVSGTRRWISTHLRLREARGLCQRYSGDTGPTRPGICGNESGP